MTDGLLPHGGLVDGFERQGDFNEFLSRSCHSVFSLIFSASHCASSRALRAMLGICRACSGVGANSIAWQTRSRSCLRLDSSASRLGSAANRPSPRAAAILWLKLAHDSRSIARLSATALSQY